MIPAPWPGDRFDVIWTFTLVPGASPAQYTFGQLPQQPLSGDTPTVIAAPRSRTGIGRPATRLAANEL